MFMISVERILVKHRMELKFTTLLFFTSANIMVELELQNEMVI